MTDNQKIKSLVFNILSMFLFIAIATVLVIFLVEQSSNHSLPYWIMFTMGALWASIAPTLWTTLHRHLNKKHKPDNNIVKQSGVVRCYHCDKPMPIIFYNPVTKDCLYLQKAGLIPRPSGA